MSEYTVSEISARSPDMSDDAFVEFVEDIRTNGQLVPIWVRGAEVIDGRKRFAACRQLGIEPRVINLSPEQDAEAVSRALNVLRTHYTFGQRAMFAADRPALQIGSVAPQVAKFGHHLPSTDELAAEVGVSRGTLNNARRVKRNAEPEVIGAVKAGELTLHAAINIADRVPRKEQAETVRKVIEASRGGSTTPVAHVLTGIDPRKDRAVRHPPQERFARAVEMIETAVDVALDNVNAIVTDTRRNDFLDSLRDARTALSRIIKSMELAA